MVPAQYRTFRVSRGSHTPRASRRKSRIPSGRRHLRNPFRNPGADFGRPSSESLASSFLEALGDQEVPAAWARVSPAPTPTPIPPRPPSTPSPPPLRRHRSRLHQFCYPCGLLQASRVTAGIKP